MPSIKRKSLPVESLLQLKHRLDTLPPRHGERKELVASMADLYGVSSATIYRALRELHKPKAATRADFGRPRKIPASQMIRYCEIVAALKLRTTNKQGRHLSTSRAIELLEKYGVETDQGHIQAPAGLLNRVTVNRFLVRWGYDHSHLTRQPPAVRFQADHSNDCWQFDLSPSDLKHIGNPSWVEPGRKQPLLMLFSVVDDRSGVCYQEYKYVYGEDVESALRFLFNAMSPKPAEGLPFCGRPKMIYLDNGPIAKSRVFQNVMKQLGIDWKTHLPAGKDGRRVTARSKGKVERPFRTVKEVHEVLYHFHKPESETEANQWLWNYLLSYNQQKHRAEDHSRIEDWLSNLPTEGLQEMCTWERFSVFAREPERRKVGIDARVTIDGTAYEVEPSLAGETVMLLWGLFDNDLYVEHQDERFGPFHPVSGPIPLHRYRKFKKSKADERADRIEHLAAQLNLPRTALTGEPEVMLIAADSARDLPRQPFEPTPAPDVCYPSIVAAKLAIADELAKPLAKLREQDLLFINTLLTETLERSIVLAQVRDYFRKPGKEGSEYAG
jgi:hypothetical protein